MARIRKLIIWLNILVQYEFIDKFYQPTEQNVNKGLP